MQVELHDRLGSPLSVPATRVILKDDFGNIIALAVQLAPGVVRIAHAGEKGFAAQLEALGLDKTLIINRVRPDKLRQPILASDSKS